MKYLILFLLITSSCATIETEDSEKKLNCRYVAQIHDLMCFEIDN